MNNVHELKNNQLQKYRGHQSNVPSIKNAGQDWRLIQRCDRKTGST